MFLNILNKKLLTRVIIGVILVLVLGAIIIRCDHRQVKELMNEKLTSGENAAVIIRPDSHSIVVVEKGPAKGKGVWSALLRGRQSQPSGPNQQIVTRIDGARGVRISVAEDGRIRVTARTRGFCFEPGMGIYTNPWHQRISLDAQLGFYGRHGLTAGLGTELSQPRHVVGHIAYSYNVWSNISIFAGMDWNRDYLLGVRTRF